MDHLQLAYIIKYTNRLRGGGGGLLTKNVNLEPGIDTLIYIKSNIERAVSGLLKACEGCLEPSPNLWLAWRTV